MENVIIFVLLIVTISFTVKKVQKGKDQLKGFSWIKILGILHEINKSNYYSHRHSIKVFELKISVYLESNLGSRSRKIHIFGTV